MTRIIQSHLFLVLKTYQYPPGKLEGVPDRLFGTRRYLPLYGIVKKRAEVLRTKSQYQMVLQNFLVVLELKMSLVHVKQGRKGQKSPLVAMNTPEILLRRFSSGDISDPIVDHKARDMHDRMLERDVKVLVAVLLLLKVIGRELLIS